MKAWNLPSRCICLRRLRMGWEAINFTERSKGQKRGFGSYQEAKKGGWGNNCYQEIWSRKFCAIMGKGMGPVRCDGWGRASFFWLSSLVGVRPGQEGLRVWLDEWANDLEGGSRQSPGEPLRWITQDKAQNVDICKTWVKRPLTFREETAWKRDVWNPLSKR